MKKILFFAAVAILVIITAGCSSLDLGGGNNLLNGGTGELALYLADKPVNDVAQVLVTLKEVQINVDDQWETIKSFDVSSGEGQFDLLDLRFNEALLGQTQLSAGTYSQIRLIVAAEKDEEGQAGMGEYSGLSQVVFKDGAVPPEEIFIPSGTQTGIKISGEFTIEPDTITEVTMDFDLARLLHQAGNGKIILRPNVIKVIVNDISANIAGRVLAEGVDDPEEITDMDIVVEALSGDEVIASTTALSAEFTPEDGGETKPVGSFLIRGLPAGEYTLKAYPVDSAGDPDLSTYLEKEITGVTVTAGETYTLPEPIILSKTVIEPVVTP